MSSVACSGRRRVRGPCPVIVLILPLEVTLLWTTFYFFRAIDAREEAFQRNVGVLGWIRGRSRVQTQDLNESTNFVVDKIPQQAVGTPT